MHRSKNRHRTAVESLEPRRLIKHSYGTNLVVNPGAEQFSGTPNGTNVITPTGWTAIGDPTVIPYGNSTYLPTAPANAGSFFFAGGPDTQGTDLFQEIDLSSVGAAIDAGEVKFTVSALVGGHGSEDDSATVFVNYQSAVQGFLGQTFIVPPFASDRNNVSELVSGSRTDTFPRGTRFAQVQIHFDRKVGTSNDGYADNVSLVLTKQASTDGTVSGRVFSDGNSNGKLDGKDKGLAGVVVYAKSSDGKTKVRATTSSKGTYTLLLPPGTYTIRQILPSGYKQIVAPKKVTIATGTALGGRNFGDHKG